MSAEEPEDEEPEVFTFDPLIAPNTVTVGGEQRLPVEIDGRRHTVQARDIERFENTLIRELKDPEGEGRDLRESPSGNVRKGSAIPIKGRWIHDWLELQGEDYINNIFRNWLFFIKALELRTKQDRAQAENPAAVTVFDRSAGTYKSMHRFITLLLEQEVLTSKGRQQVPADEYDKPVPAEFRNRKYVAVNKGFNEEKRIWENPYRSGYPDAYPELKEPVEETEEELEEVEEPLPEEQEPQEPDLEPSGLEVPSGEVSIEEFPQKRELFNFIDDAADKALELSVERTAEEVPDIPGATVDVEGFDVGRILVVGPWAVGEAVAGTTPLSLFITVRREGSPRAPSAIVTNFTMLLTTMLAERNIYPLWFDTYDVGAAFSGNFTGQLGRFLDSNGFDKTAAYNLNSQTFVNTGLSN